MALPPIFLIMWGEIGFNHQMKATLISLVCWFFRLARTPGTARSGRHSKRRDWTSAQRRGCQKRTTQRRLFAKTIKTDGNGHYISSALAVWVYKVTLLVNGTVKASIFNASANSTKPTQLTST